MITFPEIIQIVITIVAVGFIFSGLIRKESLDYFTNYSIFNWENLKFSILVTAPAIILHEMGHKLTAMFLGYNAVFHASIWGLAIGIALRLSNLGFIFFVPAYISISGPSIPLNLALIAFAGPFVNLMLFVITTLLLKYDKFPKHIRLLMFTRKINLWLFFLNMLPIPGFDGFKTYTNLLALI